METNTPYPIFRCFDIGGSGLKTALYHPITREIKDVQSLGIAEITGNPSTFTEFLKSKIPTYVSEISIPMTFIYISSAGLLGETPSGDYMIFDDWKAGGIAVKKDDWSDDKKASGYSFRELFDVSDKPNIKLRVLPDTISHLVGYRAFLQKPESLYIGNIVLGTGVVANIVRKKPEPFGQLSICTPQPLETLDHFKLPYIPNTLHPEDPYYKNTSEPNIKEIWSFLGFGNYDGSGQTYPGLSILKTTKTPEVYKEILTKRLINLISFLKKFASEKNISISEILITGGGEEFVDASQLENNVTLLNDKLNVYRGFKYVLTKRLSEKLYLEEECRSGGTRRNIKHTLNRKKTIRKKI